MRKAGTLVKQGDTVSGLGWRFDPAQWLTVRCVSITTAVILALTS